jgi:hypothetical protein
MGYVYSPSKKGFFNDDLEDVYRKSGAWPGFFVRVADADYKALIEGQANGKRIIAGPRCYPVLADYPPPSQEELIVLAEEKRQALKNEAMQSVSVLQLKLLSGRKLNATETKKLNLTLDYIDELDAINTEAAPDILWPEVPLNVA